MVNGEHALIPNLTDEDKPVQSTEISEWVGRPNKDLESSQTGDSDDIGEAISPATSPNYDPLTSFPQFKRLPPGLRQRIIALGAPSLVAFNRKGKQRNIHPLYNKGSVHLRIKEYHEKDPCVLSANDIDESCKHDNFDVTYLFVGDRMWYEDAATILYGANYFAFEDPRLLKWWLQRIGDTNTGKVRHLRIGKLLSLCLFRAFPAQSSTPTPQLIRSTTVFCALIM